MRGSPLLRSLAALLILLALGLPLRQMLRADAPVAEARPLEAATPANTTATAKIHLQLSFTTAPSRFTVSALGVPVWTETSPTAENEHDLSIAYPKEGVDLQFDLEWPAGASAAARVRLRDPDGNEIEKLIWGSGATTAVLTFP